MPDDPADERASAAAMPGSRLLDAVEVVARLRRECPWDRAQTHATLLKYLLEETYEVVEAVEAGGPEDLREELGDLLFQVLFHAEIAAEPDGDGFTIDDVADGLAEKLIRRHPHVFAGVEVSGPAEIEQRWQQIKSAEKQRVSAVDGIPAGLPALALAEAVVSRVLRSGGALSVPTAAPGAAYPGAAYTEETLGDVLFALVAAGHAVGIDAEAALRARVRREMADVRASEQQAGAAGDPD